MVSLGFLGAPAALSPWRSGDRRAFWVASTGAGRWGFACCHSTEKLSYCVGAAGREARAASIRHAQRRLEGSPARCGCPEAVAWVVVSHTSSLPLAVV